MSLELEHVAVSYGANPILRDVTARLEPGQIVGLIGPNGTGKSTLIKSIATVQRFSGAIRWQGAPVSLRDIGFMPQNCQVSAELSVLETVLLGHHEKLGLRVGHKLLDAASAILDDFRIGHLHDRCMTRLSGGNNNWCFSRSVSCASRNCCCSMRRRARSTSATRCRSLTA